LERADGCHVWDVDGNEFIDHTMGLAPVILGYGNREVTEAVIQQAHQATTLSMPHPLEVELSELLCRIIPSAEMVRFAKDGSDATSGAVRVSRAYTGRDVILCCGYHGWQDWYVGTTTRNLGVPAGVAELTDTFTYNDLASLEAKLEAHRGAVAAVILEPMGVVDPLPGFLEGVKRLASEHGAVLVFDEVVTGFRWALGGAQEYFGVSPDLTCIGKAMANGYPLSAVVGNAEIMKLFDEVFFSFTFGGEAVSLAASVATIQVMQTQPVLAHIWAQGARLQDGYNALARHYGIEKSTQAIGLPPRTVLSFSDGGQQSLLYKSLFQQECIKRGVLTIGAHNVSFSHSAQDVDQTLRVYRSVLELLADAIDRHDIEDRLEGKPVQAVFREP
jgi:glutamate-1-semialdehyde 2,1-aminomutase/spore coat polysaccharide biosynthesis protein SpsF